jgi:hypothetical protein
MIANLTPVNRGFAQSNVTPRQCHASLTLSAYSQIFDCAHNLPLDMDPALRSMRTYALNNA